MDTQTMVVYITPILNDDAEVPLEEFAHQDRYQPAMRYFVRTVKLYARLCLVGSHYYPPPLFLC